MPKTFRSYDPDQILLLPPSVKDWVPDNDLAHFISDVVDELDLKAILDAYEKGDLRGYPPYHPRMMTKLWLYAYATGRRSSRKLAALAVRDVGCMMLAAGNRPDFRTLNTFRGRHLDALGELFVQVLVMCRDAGLVRLDHVAVDGTKLKANASKHSAMSYDRMKPEVDRISEEIKQWFKDCDQTDAAEDAKYGADNSGYELPEHLRTAEKRREAIRKAMNSLKQRAKKEGKEKPTPKDQENFTDPESRIMKGGDGAFIQGYNGQAAVDACSQVIVAADLTNSAADSPQLLKVVGRIKTNLGRLPRRLSADAGYCSDDNIEKVTALGIDPYIATGRMPRSYRIPQAPKGRIPDGLTSRECMKRKLLTKAGRKQYRLRQQTVEPVFGQMKNKGWERIWLRGEAKARGEWLLHCIGHNLCKLHVAAVTG